jgi:Major capsid protein GP7
MSGTGSWPTLLDFALRTDRMGNTPDIAELLSQSNSIYEDAPIREANEKRGHEFNFRTGIPAGYWVGYNQGTPYSKSTVARSRVGMGRLRDYSQVDKSLADDEDDWEGYRQTEDEAFLMGMGQTITGTLVYGNTNITPAEFMGLAGFFNTLNPAAQNSQNVVDGGGRGASNTSLWLIDWGNDVFCISPRGSKAGIEVRNYGDTRDGHDQFGNRFPAYTCMFQIATGFVPQDWRRVVRLSNLDVTSAGLAGPNAPDLFVLMDQMLQLLPTAPTGVTGNQKTDAMRNPGSNGRPVFYANRTIRHWVNVQSMRQRNVLLSLNDYDGRSVETYRGIPIKTVDQILNNESTVSAISGPL